MLHVFQRVLSNELRTATTRKKLLAQRRPEVWWITSLRFEVVLCKQSSAGIGLHEVSRLIQVVEDDRSWVDADRVVDCGEQVSWVNRVFNRRRGGLI